jgi:hypothetical protein
MMCPKCGTTMILGLGEAPICARCLKLQVKNELVSAMTLDRAKEVGYWQKQPNLTQQDRRQL